jgi:sarcosine oxidase, subunit gamma
MPDPAQISSAQSQSTIVQITPAPCRAVLRLKSWLSADANRQSVMLSGATLPSQVGAMISGATRVLCQGPQEWLLVSDEHEAHDLREQLEPELARQGLVLIDLTDGVTVLQVQGPAARELLSKGCGLDLDSSHFSSGRCARTRFAQMSVTVVCLDDSPRFELYVGRSYAHYTSAWLADVAAALT